MSLLVGLTGSIGMGKSTAATMFADEGVPVWDADAAVHRIYARGGLAVIPIGSAFPDAIVGGQVSRARLKDTIAKDPTAIARIESIVHPLVATDRQAFIEAHRDAEILLFDIPLLFETGADSWLDATICVTAPPEVQRARVLEREGMTEQHLETILSRQMPDKEKRARSTFVIETLTVDRARARVREVLAELREKDA